MAKLQIFSVLFIVACMVEFSVQASILDIFQSNKIEDDVKFWCCTKAKPAYTQVTVGDWFLKSKIDPSKPTTIYIHGYKESYDKPHIRTLADAYIANNDHNFCVVGWGRMANLDYFTVVNNSSLLVTDYTTVFIRSLITSGFKIEQFRLIGYSTGAHMCGNIGKQMNGLIPQIFGLDPAGPLFTFPTDVGIAKRLDASDAKHVQVIHTSAYTAGTGVDCGHQDFVANNGGQQPGCALLDLDDCNHRKSVEYFTASLSPANKFVGIKCSSYPTYTLGFCKDNAKSQFGLYSDNVPGKYFFSTVAAPPYVKA